MSSSFFYPGCCGRMSHCSFIMESEETKETRPSGRTLNDTLEIRILTYKSDINEPIDNKTSFGILVMRHFRDSRVDKLPGAVAYVGEDFEAKPRLPATGYSFLIPPKDLKIVNFDKLFKELPDLPQSHGHLNLVRNQDAEKEVDETHSQVDSNWLF